MSIPSFAGAPLSKALVITVTLASVLAAVTSTQQYFNVPLVPHLTRDHQFLRLISSHLAFTNSSELFLAVLILWYTSPGVERIWGTRKLASFLVVVTALATALSTLLLFVGWRVTSGRFNTLPAGPFAVVFALVHQSNRIVPTLYHFRLFHPTLTLTNRFPLYLLSLLLFTSQPPFTSLLSLVGILASSIYLSSPSLSSFRLPPRLYAFLVRFGSKAFGDPAKERARLRRGMAVTPEEAMLLAMVTSSGAGAGAAAGFDVASVRGVARRRDAARPAAGAGASATAEAGEDAEAEEGDAAEETSTAASAPPATAASTAARPLPRISGTSFLQQWSAGLTGSAEGPSQAQITELQNIFPHNSRQAIVAALVDNGLNHGRAAEALLASGHNS